MNAQRIVHNYIEYSLQGIKARIYETFVVLVLLVVVVTSIVWVALGIVNSEYVFGPENDDRKLYIIVNDNMHYGDIWRM